VLTCSRAGDSSRSFAFALNFISTTQSPTGAVSRATVEQPRYEAYSYFPPESQDAIGFKRATRVSDLKCLEMYERCDRSKHDAE
jgi:hypothetical protein